MLEYCLVLRLQFILINAQLNLLQAFYPMELVNVRIINTYQEVVAFLVMVLVNTVMIQGILTATLVMITIYMMEVNVSPATLHVLHVMPVQLVHVYRVLILEL